MPFEEPTPATVFLMRLMLTFVEGSFYRRYVEEMGLEGDEAVLEYGPGPGKMSKYLARALPRGRLACVDVSRVWMGVIRKVLRNYHNVDFIRGDMPWPAIDDGAFDVLVISFVLHDVDGEERQKMVDALVKKLKKGGRVFAREPEKAGHGMPGDEVRGLMRNAGLEELTFERKRPAFIGPISLGTFEKS